MTVSHLARRRALGAAGTAALLALSGAGAAQAPSTAQSPARTPAPGSPAATGSVSATVLVAHPVVQALARALTEGTGVQIVRPAPESLPPGRIHAYFTGRGAEALATAAAQADAALTLRSRCAPSGRTTRCTRWRGAAASA